ncbi:cwf18 pre-mRNA splicing factor protein [Besnoitia besnoiti]|uniref:Cwf18 pre-mRNA splicing factor protein n=1 Tax=Besnoitia besnoiti TaxID=94643 RepID=A0A2A9MDB6_BESBE|nr:cwf18 pre-mRNA splicing factor protein [Besnoitia besnoiti]PFH33370.1 cwf18 pre-mRNA splicing factor protein [Besnoitia besnoiti]
MTLEQNTDFADDNQNEHVPLKFRNYVPRDVALRRFCLPRPSVEELEKQIDKEANNAVKSAANEDVVSQIAPRRPNWDLKRDVEKKLSILSRKTDRAIVDLIRMKIADAKPLTVSTAPGDVADERPLDGERELAQSLVNALRDLEKLEGEECE